MLSTIFDFLKFFMIRSWKKHNQVCKSPEQVPVNCVRPTWAGSCFPLRTTRASVIPPLGGLRTVPWALSQCPMLADTPTSIEAYPSALCFPGLSLLFKHWFHLLQRLLRYLNSGSVSDAFQTPLSQLGPQEQWCDLILDGILYLHISF